MEGIDRGVADRLAEGVAGEFLEGALGDPGPAVAGGPDADPELDRVLTPAQLAAVEVLAAGGTVAAAAAAGVARRVAAGWRTDDPVFLGELNARKQDRLDLVQGRLRGLAEKAIEALARMIEDDGLPGAVRLRAIQLVLAASGGLGKADEIGPCEPAAAKRAISRRRMEELLDDI
jgi:hypothetical protein